MLAFHQADYKRAELWNKMEVIMSYLYDDYFKALEEEKSEESVLEKENLMILLRIMTERKIPND